jgi:hypothetical protein
VAVATAAVVIAAPAQEPPLVVTPPPEELDGDETPEDGEIPDDEELLDDEDPPVVVPVEVPVEVPPDDDPFDEDEDEPTDRCGSMVLMCANLAPMTAARAADSRPTRQVIFLTRRRPSSRARTALEYSVRFTANRVNR